MLTISGESLRSYSWWLSDTPSTDWPDLPGTCVLGRHSDLSPIRIAPSEIGPTRPSGKRRYAALIRTVLWHPPEFPVKSQRSSNSSRCPIFSRSEEHTSELQSPCN